MLSEKLREISEAEGVEVEPAAVTLIAREGRGSFRDAEGLLDQLASFADGPVTAARVRELLGSASSEALLETTQALYERRAADALRIVDRLQNEGKDLSRFVGELVAHLRRLMLLPHAPEIALAEVGGEERAGLEEQASHIPTAEVVRMIEALGDSLSRAKRGDPKLELELTFLKLARDYAEPSVDALIGRLETLENAIAKGATVAAVPAMSSRAEEAESENSEQDAPAEAAAPEATLHVGENRGDGESEEAGPGNDPEREDERVETIGAVVAQWARVIQDLKDRKQALTATVFAEGVPSSFQDGILEISFPKESDFYAKEAVKSRHGEALGEVLERRFGVRPRLELRVAGAEGSASADYSRPNIPPEDANGDPSPSRMSHDVFFEAAPETPPEPEGGTPRGILEGVDDALVPEGEPGAEPRAEAGEKTEADGTIQDQWDVLSMARELFGPGEDLPGDKQSRGGSGQHGAIG